MSTKELREPLGAPPAGLDDRPPEAAADELGKDADLAASLAQIILGVAKLQNSFDARLAYDETKEAAFQRLYADLQDAKLAQSLEATRPLLLDLLLLHDRVDTAIRASGVTSEASACASFKEELLEVLYRRDVRRFGSSAERFDPETQQAVEIVETADPAEHQRVERVVRAGFRWGTRVLRAEDVVIRQRRRVPPSSTGPT